MQTATDLGVPHTLCQRSMTRVLTQALRLSAPDAGRRVRAAQQLGDRRALTGASLPPLRPHLAAAQRRGEISAEQVGVVDRGLRAVDHPGFDPADVEAGEEILARQARNLCRPRRAEDRHPDCGEAASILTAPSPTMIGSDRPGTSG